MLIATLCLAVAPSLVDQPQPWQEPTPTVAPGKTAKNSIFSYTYVQLNLVLGDADGFSDGPDGIDLSGSYGFDNNLFVFGGLQHLSGEVGPTDVDIDTLKIGLGYHQPIVQNTDLVLGVALMHADADPGSSQDGYELRAGVRNQTTEQVELDGALGFTDFDDSDSNVFLEVGAVYRATPQLGLLATIYFSDDIDTFSIGARYQP